MHGVVIDLGQPRGIVYHWLRRDRISTAHEEFRVHGMNSVGAVRVNRWSSSSGFITCAMHGVVIDLGSRLYHQGAYIGCCALDQSNVGFRVHDMN